MAASTSALISRSLPLRCSSSIWKWRMTSAPFRVEFRAVSAEAACNVIFGFLLSRVLEDHGGVIELNQLAHQEKAGVVRYARCLLHVMGDDHNGAAVLELENQVLDLGGRDGIQ